MERWATFDCYGTLVDWNGGHRRRARAALRRVDRRGELLRGATTRSSRRSSATARCRTARCWRRRSTAVAAGGGARPARRRARRARPLAPGLAACSRRCRPRWTRLARRGWRLAMLSNSDRDLIEASLASIGVPFDLAVVAGEIGSYKPAHGHWVASSRSRAAPTRGATSTSARATSTTSPPRRELGLPVIWINRLGETGGPAPTRELADLTGLAGYARRAGARRERPPSGLDRPPRRARALPGGRHRRVGRVRLDRGRPARRVGASSTSSATPGWSSSTAGSRATASFDDRGDGRLQGDGYVHPELPGPRRRLAPRRPLRAARRRNRGRAARSRPPRCEATAPPTRSSLAAATSRCGTSTGC